MNLRAEAEALASSLPRLRIGGALASDAAHLGSAGRRRAGTGEDFWQYRQHMPEDGSQRVDWRRSARGDTLFVRETELETARTFLFWADPHAGFHWSGDQARPSKGHYASVLLLALSSLLSKEGERVGIMGGRKAGFGSRSLQRMLEDLSALTDTFPAAPRNLASAVIFSDFYDDDTVWQKRLIPLSSTCRQGVLVMVTDPVEETFPFRGRVMLSRPGTQDERLLGRAELIEDAYLKKFAAKKDAVKALAARLGWQSLFLSTRSPVLNGATKLHRALEQIEART